LTGKDLLIKIYKMDENGVAKEGKRVISMQLDDKDCEFLPSLEPEI